MTLANRPQGNGGTGGAPRSGRERRRLGDGGAVVSFTFSYLLGIVDEEGIAAVDWIYSLRVPRGGTLFTLEQPMRDAQPEKTEILVVGDRTREFEVPAGSLDAGITYVLWFELYYRGERLGEFLEPLRLVPGEQVTEPFDPDQEI